MIGFSTYFIQFTFFPESLGDSQNVDRFRFSKKVGDRFKYVLVSLYIKRFWR